MNSESKNFEKSHISSLLFFLKKNVINRESECLEYIWKFFLKDLIFTIGRETGEMVQLLRVLFTLAEDPSTFLSA